MNRAKVISSLHGSKIIGEKKTEEKRKIGKRRKESSKVEGRGEEGRRGEKRGEEKSREEMWGGEWRWEGKTREGYLASLSIVN